MNRVSSDRMAEFEAIVEKYNQCFYDRDVEALRSMYVQDADVIFWDNHAECDSPDLNDHVAKVGGFFASLRSASAPVEQVSVEDLCVWANDSVACMTMVMRYASKPRPGVRTTCVLQKAGNAWRIRHMHFSTDPTEQFNES